MEYRKLPRGRDDERFSVLGLGMGGIGKTPVNEIEVIVSKAIAHGINFFDLCTAGASYAPIGRAIKNCRNDIFLQVHFGAVYDENGEYGWCRDFNTIKKTFLWELKELQTDYVDFGFLHCVDEDEDVGEVSTAQAMPERVKISDNSAMGINFNFFIFNTFYFSEKNTS